MDVRKWTERQTDKVWELCQHSERDICPACVADAFAPTITKLVEALQRGVDLKTYSGRRKSWDAWEDEAREALAELEKP